MSGTPILNWTLRALLASVLLGSVAGQAPRRGSRSAPG
jgi:hypothetical protein